jgi:hypothetical protein
VGPAASPTPAPAAQDEEGWKAFGHALTLAQILMRSASDPDPDKAMDDVLAGRSTEANRAIAGLLEEATADMLLRIVARGVDRAGCRLAGTQTD